MELTVPALETVRVGFIGLGARGSTMLEQFTYIEGVEVIALYDTDSVAS